jgi:hypothetical protein
MSVAYLIIEPRTKERMNDRIEMLTRELERWGIICEIQNSIATCNETERECDVCVGMRYAINIIKRRMENE